MSVKELYVVVYVSRANGVVVVDSVCKTEEEVFKRIDNLDKIGIAIKNACGFHKVPFYDEL